MGDGGSYILGFNFSVLPIIGTTNISTMINSNALKVNAIFPLLILLLPLLDMTLVILSRLIKKKSPFLPDQSHIHHRLLNLGFSQKKDS